MIDSSEQRHPGEEAPSVPTGFPSAPQELPTSRRLLELEQMDGWRSGVAAPNRTRKQNQTVILRTHQLEQSEREQVRGQSPANAAADSAFLG